MGGSRSLAKAEPSRALYSTFLPEPASHLSLGWTRCGRVAAALGAERKTRKRRVSVCISCTRPICKTEEVTPRRSNFPRGELYKRGRVVSWRELQIQFSSVMSFYSDKGRKETGRNMYGCGSTLHRDALS